MNTETYINLGVIQQVQGLKGNLVALLNHDISTLKLEAIFIQIDHTLVPYLVERLSSQFPKAVIKLQGVDGPEKAYLLKGSPIFVPREALPLRSDPEEQLERLIGYCVVDIQEGSLGIVQDIYAPPQQILLAVNYQGRELLIPYHKELITHVDHEQGKVSVHLPAGFIQAAY